MIVLNNLLDAASLARVQEILKTADFTDGRQSAGDAARLVKNNLQAKGSTTLDEARGLIGGAVSKSPAVAAIALPAAMTPPLFNRYDIGMEYGAHFDNAVISGLRTDLSMTVFLSDDYDGGELVVEGTPWKLPPGSAVLYPSGSIHHVEKVTRGSRLAAILWIQSLVRDVKKRDLLREMADISSDLASDGEKLRLNRIRTELIRLWAGT